MKSKKIVISTSELAELIFNSFMEGFETAKQTLAGVNLDKEKLKKNFEKKFEVIANRENKK